MTPRSKPLTTVVRLSLLLIGILWHTTLCLDHEQEKASVSDSASTTPTSLGDEFSSEFIPNLKPDTTRFDTLAGRMPDTLRAGKRPYLVVANLTVPADETTVIERGVVLLFKNFTGIHVEGTLIAKGTRPNPIIFSSENDIAYHPGNLLPNPFDWDGIFIYPGAIGTILSNCTVSYSAYGIRSDTKFIRLNSISFANNGKSNLTIEGNEYQVSGEPYTYVLSARDARVDGVPAKILDPMATKRLNFAVTGITVAIAGMANGVYWGLRWQESRRELERLSSKDPMFLKQNPDGTAWVQARDERNSLRARTVASGIVAVIGWIGFGWAFTF
jgi:hypothetical protein